MVGVLVILKTLNAQTPDRGRLYRGLVIALLDVLYQRFEHQKQVTDVP